MLGYILPTAHEIKQVRQTIDEFYVHKLSIPPAKKELPQLNIIKYYNFNSPGFKGDIYFCLWPAGPNSMEVVLHERESGRWLVYHSISGSDPAWICDELFNPEDEG
jgi:hypothetical protein